MAPFLFLFLAYSFSLSPPTEPSGNWNLGGWWPKRGRDRGREHHALSFAIGPALPFVKKEKTIRGHFGLIIDHFQH